MKIEAKKNLFEYRFHFHLVNSDGYSDKYFLAHDFDEAKKMFEYACTKRSYTALLDKVEKWNRWSDKWEKVDIPAQDPALN